MTKYGQAKWLFWGHYISIPIIGGLVYAGIQIGFEIPGLIGVVVGYILLRQIIVRLFFRCPKCRRPLLRYDNLNRIKIPSKKCIECGTDLTKS